MGNKKRLIDANFTKAAIQNYIANNEVTEAFVEIAGHICGMLDDCETVDAVEVVRCKDCLWRNEGGDCTHKWWTDVEGWYKYVGDDDFCSYGERKVDNA
jgi:hypothetical protein